MVCQSGVHIAGESREGGGGIAAEQDYRLVCEVSTKARVYGTRQSLALAALWFACATLYGREVLRARQSVSHVDRPELFRTAFERQLELHRESNGEGSLV